MKKIYYQLSSVCQQKTPLNKGRYVFSWGGGGRAREFWYFFQKKVLALPHVLIKKLLTPHWQKCDPPLTTELKETSWKEKT